MRALPLALRHRAEQCRSWPEGKHIRRFPATTNWATGVTLPKLCAPGTAAGAEPLTTRSTIARRPPASAIPIRPVSRGTSATTSSDGRRIVAALDSLAGAAPTIIGANPPVPATATANCTCAPRTRLFHIFRHRRSCPSKPSCAPLKRALHDHANSRNLTEPCRRPSPDGYF